MSVCIALTQQLSVQLWPNAVAIHVGSAAFGLGGGLATTQQPHSAISAPQVRIDLKRVIEERFGVTYSERGISDLLAALSFSHISARPQHPRQGAGHRGV